MRKSKGHARSKSVSFFDESIHTPGFMSPPSKQSASRKVVHRSSTKKVNPASAIGGCDSVEVSAGRLGGEDTFGYGHALAGEIEECRSLRESSTAANRAVAESANRLGEEMARQASEDMDTLADDVNCMNMDMDMDCDSHGLEDFGGGNFDCSIEIGFD